MLSFIKCFERVLIKIISDLFPDKEVNCTVMCPLLVFPDNCYQPQQGIAENIFETR